MTNIVTEVVVPRLRCRPDLAANLPRQLLQLVIVAVAIGFLGNFDELRPIAQPAKYMSIQNIQ